MGDASDLATWHGISLGSAITGGGVWSGVFGMGYYWLRSRVPMRKMRIEADESLRSELLQRLATVEASSEKRVKDLEDKLEAQRVEADHKLAAERARSDREIAILRHRSNNMAQCLDAVIMLIEAAPERATEHIIKVREMRSRQEVAEAAEKGDYAKEKIETARVGGIMQ